jgi:hypothetical protein
MFDEKNIELDEKHSKEKIKEYLVRDNDGNIQLDKNITAGTGDYRFNVDKNVTIDLNGYTIDRNLNEQQDNVFSVIAGGTLIIKDTSEGQNGKITGGWANEDYAGRNVNIRIRQYCWKS